MPDEERIGGRSAVRCYALLLAALPCLAGCSVRTLAVRTAAHALSSGGGVYASDEDPELVGAALPFALKTLEGLLAQDPRNQELLLAASRGFTQYSWAFVQLPAERRDEHDPAGAAEQRARSARLYLRARDYALRGLAVRHPALEEQLRRDPLAAAGALDRAELPLVYWAAASWGSAIALCKDQPALLGDLPAVQALMERALLLDESWERGAAHAALMSLEMAMPVAAGGSPSRAREHYRRALALTGGHDATLYVSAAQALAVSTQDRTQFDSLLQQAMRVDLAAAPDLRLANALAQVQASWLLAHAEDFFIDNPAPAVPAAPTTPEGAHQP